MSLFETGIRPTIDAYIQTRAKEKRNYGKYWGASSAGYCMRLNILRRLDIPQVPEIAEDALRTQRVFDVGHTFHEWIQKITKEAGLTIAQELELQDEDLMIRGHIDDLVLITVSPAFDPPENAPSQQVPYEGESKLILYDYKTANSQSFNYKRPEMGHYHKMQLGTYMYMLRKTPGLLTVTKHTIHETTYDLTEARILTISKDDLRMKEQQIFWTPQLEKEVVGYWRTLQGYWDKKTLPRCTCLEHDGGFMGRRSKKGKVYNPFFLDGVPCSDEWIKDKLPEGWSL